MWLLDRLRTLSDYSLFIFSILVILFSWRSRTSRFFIASRGNFIPSIWFLDIINTLKLSETPYRFETSLILFMLRSIKVRLGSETKFSILTISLFYKLRYLIFSSPSRRGICLRQRESRFIFSKLVSRSLGRR
jgi:hypothetical protein